MKRVDKDEMIRKLTFRAMALRYSLRRSNRIFWLPKTNHLILSGIFFLFFLIYAFICTCREQNFKGAIPLGIITWSVLDKQNVYALIDSFDLKIRCRLTFLLNLFQCSLLRHRLRSRHREGTD